jgi:MoaA/NifB/PqqE/SkfB family radical SAM enzyme
LNLPPHRRRTLEEVAEARLRSVRQGRLLAGPETLQVNLQNACNLNCIFCWNHSPLLRTHPPDWHRQRLSEAHLADVIASLPGLRPGRLQLSGRGEPLLHPGAMRLLGAARSLGVPTTVQTNGLDGPSPRQLVEVGVEHLAVNLSAGTEEGFERTHPGKGHRLGAVVERLEAIAELRSPAGTPRVTVLAVIQQESTEELVPLVELAAAVGAEGVQLKGMEHLAGLEQLALAGAELDRARTELGRARRRAEALGVRLDADHLEWVLRPTTRDGRFSEQLAAGPCFMGWYYLRVTCDGRVMFCCKDKLVDHLDRRSLYAIWRSAAYHLLRLGGRDGDSTVGLFDAKCRACSNVLRNEEIRLALAARESG